MKKLNTNKMLRETEKRLENLEISSVFNSLYGHYIFLYLKKKKIMKINDEILKSISNRQNDRWLRLIELSKKAFWELSKITAKMYIKENKRFEKNKGTKKLSKGA